MRIIRHRFKFIIFFIILMQFIATLTSINAKATSSKGPKGEKPHPKKEPKHKKDLKDLETRIQERIAQEVSKLKADLNENIGIFKAARTRLMNEIEALKSSNRNQTIRISQLEDLLLKMNKTD